MASTFYCPAYDNVTGRLHLENGCIYLSLVMGKSDLHITLNPTQASVLGAALQSSSDYLRVEDVADEKYFGNLEMEFDPVEAEEEVTVSNEPYVFHPATIPEAERPVA
ncbi:MAG: hypothetical protein SPL39_11870 [Selenomonadaceae bacterium]|nr:hypothetical protein [Selenomonadaceae bacterium]